MKRLEIPKFANEAEEAQWWYDHRDMLDENFIEAVKKGTIHVGGPAAILRETRLVTVRLANRDLDRVEQVAKERGIGDHACIAELLREALDREDAKKAKKRKSA